MAAVNDATEAKRLVQQIPMQRGYLGADWALEAIPDPERRREYEEAMLVRDKMTGASVIALAKNLYSSKARFVLEMLQNADDNSYENARSAGHERYMSFAVYPDRIIAECNEDGFSQANLSAICAVGESSKIAAQGYIGEKGIGFKSVFMVAWKVHIQSRAFSFSFTHNRGGSGMGMISPVWEEAISEPPRGVTRITLSLHEEAISGNLRQSINSQFANLQEEFLLFMKNLQRVSIAFHKDLGQAPSRSTSYSVSRPQLNRAVIQTVSTDDGSSATTSRSFHITTRRATNLPRNENRQYSEKESAARAYATAEVVLAFPLTMESEPVIEAQKLFVFLPVRAVGFSFIIQADFVTDASRQDVVSDSPRNKMLVEEIAKTFTLAVTQFCKHPTLLYQWMRYLPSRNDPHRGTLWSMLVDRLAAELMITPVLVGRRYFQLFNIPHFLRPTGDVLDQHNEPLLKDGDGPGKLISSAYMTDDLDTLKAYGLKYATVGHVLQWVRDDLASPLASRIRSADMPDDWSTRFGQLLQRPFVQKWDQIIAKLKVLRLVPLANGDWVSTSSCSVYSTCANGLSVPLDLDLCILSPKATNSELLKLYQFLGVKKAPVKLVQEKIRERYSSQVTRDKITLEDSRAHLRFLYLSYNHDNPNTIKYNWLSVFHSKDHLLSPTDYEVYIQDDSPYGPWELFRATDPGTHPGAGAPGFERVSFLHPSYSQSIPESSTRSSWNDWLKRAVDLEDDVRLDSFEEDGKLRYLQKHRPEKFLGALRESHVKFGLPAGIVCQLQETQVLCRGNTKELLKFTYFPTTDLERRFERYVGTGTTFPWLWIDDGPETRPHQSIPDAWKFLLNTLQVGVPRNDVDFALQMLDAVACRVASGNSPEDVESLFELYRHLASRYQESDTRVEDGNEIREFFDNDGMLYVASQDPEEDLEYLAPLADCVWTAPAPMKSKFVLSLIWKRVFKDDADAKSLSSFFKNVVKVSNCSYETYVDELRALKNCDSKDIDVIRVWYKALNRTRNRQRADEDESRFFDDEALIYLPLDDNENSWHTVSDCVWSGAARLRSKASLNEEYGDLEDFFVNFLGVRRIDLGMAVSELKDAGKRLSLTDVRTSIWTLNSLLEAEEQRDFSLGPEDNIFPVRESNGDVHCASTSSDFVVVDRYYEWSAFEGRVRSLDFTLEEVAKLRPLLRWANLERCLLSRCVREVTSLGDSPAELVLDREQQIANRAHALLRIAIHAGSPRAHGRQKQEALYTLLQNARVFRTDGVVSGIKLSQDGDSYTADGKSIAVYLWEDSTSLKVYLPTHRKQRKHAFNNILPKKVLEWFMTDPKSLIPTNTVAENLNATKDVFTTDPSLLDETLEENGIATVEIDNSDEIELSETASTISDEDDLGLNGFAALELGHGNETAMSDSASTVSGPTDNGRSAVYTPAGSTEAGEPYSTTVSASSQHGHGGPRLQPHRQHSSPYDLPMGPEISPVTPPHLASDDSQYIDLLQAVITAARRESIPAHNATDIVPSGVSTTERQRFRFRHSSQIERDCKIGAAGELYVFELLSHLGFAGDQLPDFTRHNWQSNVRKYVSAHPEYSDLVPWSGPETSDIVYSDTTGRLTSQLVATGHLDEQQWFLSGRRPKYYIEVKATTMCCETPFYMSKAQYARMERNVLSPGHGDSIYVIFRVYNLGQESMGLKIYMDPGTLRRNGSLDFTAEQWSVEPA